MMCVCGHKGHKATLWNHFSPSILNEFWGWESVHTSFVQQAPLLASQQPLKEFFGGVWFLFCFDIAPCYMDV